MKNTITNFFSVNRSRAFTYKSVLAITLLFALSSCRSYEEIPYFKDVNRRAVTEEEINNYSPLVIQPNDIIGINVGSLNAQASAAFNLNPDNNPDLGYVVDEKGEIKLPYVGVMKVSGLSTQELRTQLQRSLLTYLREPTVNVRILNFKIAVIGDVLRPDVYPVPHSERMSVIEGLALAGDLNITGLREILLIREINGKRAYVPLDLKSKNIFNSPYFYLKNNDMIYVTPHKTKLAIVENSKFNVLLSTLSILALIATQAIIR